VNRTPLPQKRGLSGRTPARRAAFGGRFRNR
jgi:hypothetical protein